MTDRVTQVSNPRFLQLSMSLLRYRRGRATAWRHSAKTGFAWLSFYDYYATLSLSFEQSIVLAECLQSCRWQAYLHSSAVFISQLIIIPSGRVFILPETASISQDQTLCNPGLAKVNDLPELVNSHDRNARQGKPSLKVGAS